MGECFLCQGSPNRTSRIHACVYVDMYVFKELTYVILEAGGFEIFRTGWQAGNSGKS